LISTLDEKYLPHIGEPLGYFSLNTHHTLPKPIKYLPKTKEFSRCRHAYISTIGLSHYGFSVLVNKLVCGFGEPVFSILQYNLTCIAYHCTMYVVLLKEKRAFAFVDCGGKRKGKRGLPIYREELLSFPLRKY
jgi:hypothetical protein